MGAIASQITSLTIVFSSVYLDTDQRKHQSSASLAFVWGIHRRPVNSPHKWPVTRKMSTFDDVIMIDISYSSECQKYRQGIPLRLMIKVYQTGDRLNNLQCQGTKRAVLQRYCVFSDMTTLKRSNISICCKIISLFLFFVAIFQAAHVINAEIHSLNISTFHLLKCSSGIYTCIFCHFRLVDIVNITAADVMVMPKGNAPADMALT